MDYLSLELAGPLLEVVGALVQLRQLAVSLQHLNRSHHFTHSSVKFWNPYPVQPGIYRSSTRFMSSSENFRQFDPMMQILNPGRILNFYRK